MKLALRNIFRHRARTLVTLTAIIMGVICLILSSGFVRDITFQLGEAIIHSQTGHIQVFRENFLSKGTRQPNQFLIENPDQVTAKIALIPNVVQVTSRLNFTGLLNNGRRDLAVAGEGVEPDKEAAIGTYLSLTAGRMLTDQDRDGIMIGQGVAHALGLSEGDRVTFLMNTADGALNTLDFMVVGIFQTFSKDFDARAIRIPLKAAQELLDNRGANLLVVMLQHTEDTEQVMSKLDDTLAAQRLEHMSWHQLSDFYEKSVTMYEAQFGVLRLIILLMVLLSVANSINMTLFERTSEFGTILALGSRPASVFRMIMLESTLLGLIGAGLGMLLGLAAAWIISWIGIPMPPPPNANIGYTASIRLIPVDILIAGFIGFIATWLAAIIPARRASNLFIVDALRQGV